MKTTRTFRMNGKVYTSMMDIARDLGLKRVYPRDFAKLGIEEITDDSTDVQDNSTDVKVESVQVDAQEDKADEEKTAEKKETAKQPKKEQKKQPEKKSEATAKAAKKEVENQPKVDKRFTRKLGTPEQIKEVQDNVSKMNINEFSNFIKHFAVEALVQMAEDAGVNTWENMENEPIRKMRLLMELKAHYYPNDKTPVKPSSQWRKNTLEELLGLAKAKKLQYKTSDDPKIQRMWVIVALNDANLTPQDLKK